MSQAPQPCPFKPGDKVVYAPDDRTYGLDAMRSDRLVRGHVYIVRQILRDTYVVVAGRSHPGDLHGSCFRPA